MDSYLRQLTKLFRFSALCLVQQWIHIGVSLQRPGLWFKTAENWKIRSCSSSMVVDFLVVVQMQIPMVMLFSRPQRLPCCSSTR